MAETELGIYYPTEEDPVRIPADMQKLAESVDAIQWLSQSLKPTMGLKTATENVVLPENEWANVPGCKLEISPVVASVLMVVISIGNATGGVGQLISGSIKVDGETERAAVARSVSNESKTLLGTQFYVEPLSAAAHTITLRAKAASKSFTLEAANTRMSYLMFAS